MGEILKDAPGAELCNSSSFFEDADFELVEFALSNERVRRIVSKNSLFAVRGAHREKSASRYKQPATIGYLLVREIDHGR